MGPGFPAQERGTGRWCFWKGPLLQGTALLPCCQQCQRSDRWRSEVGESLLRRSGAAQRLSPPWPGGRRLLPPVASPLGLGEPFSCQMAPANCRGCCRGSRWLWVDPWGLCDRDWALDMGSRSPSLCRVTTGSFGAFCQAHLAGPSLSDPGTGIPVSASVQKQRWGQLGIGVNVTPWSPARLGTLPSFQKVLWCPSPGHAVLIPITRNFEVSPGLGGLGWPVRQPSELHARVWSRPVPSGIHALREETPSWEPTPRGSSLTVEKETCSGLQVTTPKPGPACSCRSSLGEARGLAVPRDRDRQRVQLLPSLAGSRER